jgi:ubiquinol-cytochrome c reductase cytochrome b subunit
MRVFFNWIDDRTGLGQAIRDFRAATVPGRACICRSLCFALVFMFLVQGITGLFLLMYYSPGAQSAWESVYYLQHDVQGGWLLRAVHHYSGQAILVLVGIYLVGMILAGRYRPPREFVFWVVVFLGLVTLGSLLTGDLLAWDQNSQSATLVRVKFLTLLPVVGGDLFKLAAGGPSFGHLTLTRFLALHTVVLAGAFLGLMVLHAWFAHRANVVARAGANPHVRNTPLWPKQVLVNVVGCMVVLAIVLLLALSHGVSGDHAGVALGAPADPSDFYAAARPEWAFMGLYGFSNLFPGHLKLLPIFVIPGTLVLLFLLMPFVGRLKIGHAFNVLLTLGLLAGNGALSYMVYAHDRENEEHQLALATGNQESERVIELIRSNDGIPVSGALTLLRDDPKTQGPKLFRQHCASCHDYVGGTDDDIKAEKVSAPNLFGYGTKAWMAGWLDPKRIAAPDYYGNTKFKNGDMVDFVKETYSDMEKEDKEEIDTLLVALAAEAKLKSEAAEDAKNAERIAEGKKLIAGCVDCHKYYDKGQLGTSADLTGYASREWTAGIIANPAHGRFYGDKNDRMPAYAESDDASKNMLTRHDIELLTDWLRGEWSEPEE